ncbi:MAG: ATP-dependent helicase [bacterium]
MNPKANEFLKKLKQDLNPPQYEAVTYTGGPLLVLAGAGSGKTRVITYRVAYLISVLGLAPWNVLAVTFTNKAAREMQERVQELLGGMPKGLWIGTFHSICARILRMDGQAMGIDSNFVIYDTADQTAAVKRARAQCQIGEDNRVSPAQFLYQISQAKNRFEGPKEYTEKAKSAIDQAAAVVYAEYQKVLRANHALDFDDLLLECVRLIRSVPSVGDVYRQRFQHILVDEYQDTNVPQAMLIKELARGHGQVCVVGDDDQSIYRWRGAAVENILFFGRDYGNLRTVRLEQNYRSTQTILEAAGGLIRHNQSRHAKTLWTKGVMGEKAGIVNLPEEHSEAYWICGQAQRLHEGEEKVPYGDIAVFFRTNAQSRLFEEECVRRGIPYTVVGGMAFYQRKEIKDVLAFARLLINPADVVAFERIINIPSRKLGEKTVQKLIQAAERMNVPILEAARRAGERGAAAGLPPASRTGFMEFANQFEHWQSLSGPLSAHELAEKIVTESGYMDLLQESPNPQDEARVENVRELINSVALFEEKLETPAPLDTLSILQHYLENIALISDVDQMNESGDALVLMTVHSAKGLEFPYVFMAGMEEGLFPYRRAVESPNPEDMEEERRLGYVGITRAKKKVYLTYADSRQLYNRREPSQPSRFIGEIPNQYKERIVWNANLDSLMEGPGWLPEFDTPARETRPARVPEVRFSPGDMVTHRTFGFGVVLNVEGEGEKTLITIEFQEVGRKILAQQYAKLRKV